MIFIYLPRLIILTLEIAASNTNNTHLESLPQDILKTIDNMTTYKQYLIHINLFEGNRSDDHPFIYSIVNSYNKDDVLKELIHHDTKAIIADLLTCNTINVCSHHDDGDINETWEKISNDQMEQDIYSSRFDDTQDYVNFLKKNKEDILIILNASDRIEITEIIPNNKLS